MPGISFMIVICFIWAGFMAAISFMESWLKFWAPGVELSIGLSIGRLIFKALNRIEWCFLVVLWGGYLLAGPVVLPLNYFILTLILLIQTIWLLPVMDRRAAATIEGQQLPRSFLHIWFAGLEVIKFIVLIIAGINLI